jgi:arylformamidase
MTIHDVTVAISSDMPIYKGDPDAAVESFKAIARGDSANVSSIRFGVHSGTHVDAPNHFIDGTKQVHDLDLAKLIGPCRVIDVGPDVREIEPEHMGDITGVERVIFKTRNSDFWSTPEDGFRKDFTYITPATAQMLADADIKLVGIDYLSIERSGGPGKPVHIALLEKEIIILEGVDLRNVAAGDYELICLPLKYIGSTGDGAPARTVLIER